MDDLILNALISASETAMVAETRIVVFSRGAVIAGTIAPPSAILQDAFTMSLGEDTARQIGQASKVATSGLLSLSQVEVLTPSGTVLKSPYLRIALDAVEAWAGGSLEAPLSPAR